MGRAEEDHRLAEVAKILCGHFSPHLWTGVAADKPELKQLIRQPGSTREINEATKSDFRQAAFDVLVWLRDRDRSGEADETLQAAQPKARARAVGIAQTTPQPSPKGEA